ncbi:flagellar FliJ family protein [Phenylobacterium sp.]|uniref:flagellar FliJ family protein n=1 Tax=Phenylobacterium sp. TaxID=1871053 RepID=UPI00261AB503|nr:flagellar FliJ family protein [Phenylobacterium sp.]
MSWSASLIKLAAYEVEVCQGRLADVAARRGEAEMRLAVLEAEGLAELARAEADPISGLYQAAFMQALRARKAEARARIAALAAEEQGARDALAQAFEAQKKYEHLAEQARLRERQAEGRRETAALDELARRRKAAG